METSSLICRANPCTGFYMTGTSAMKALMTHNNLIQSTGIQQQRSWESQPEGILISVFEKFVFGGIGQSQPLYIIEATTGDVL